MESETYAETHSLYNGQLFIYSLKKSVNKTFQVRIRIPGHKKPIRRSLNTRLLHEAIHLAQELYLELRARASQDLPLGVTSFEDAFRAYVKYRREGTNRSNAACDKYIRNLELYFLPYFGQFTDINQIDDSSVSAYWPWRMEYWITRGMGMRLGNTRRLQQTSTNPSWNTLNHEQTRLRNVFAFAKDKGWLAQVPQVHHPVSKRAGPNRRAGFTVSEYRKVLRAVEGKIRKKTQPSRKKKNGKTYKAYTHTHNTRGWHAYKAYMLTIANTGIRVQELAQVRWEQLELRHDRKSGNSYTIIHITREQSKTDKARSVISRDFHKTYDYLMRWKEQAIYTDPKDLIFTADNRKSKFIVGEYTGGPGVPRDFTHMTKSILRQVGLHTKQEGGYTYQRSSTSFRHFYCSMRLLEGCPIKPLADNMGTSYKMIEENYSHLIPWDMRDFLTRHHSGYGRETLQPDEQKLLAGDDDT